MTKSTITIPSIEMTRDEHDALWEAGWNKWLDRGIDQWNTSDGRNEIQFDGENFYRVVVIKEN
jgi:hypothetical protein